MSTTKPTIDARPPLDPDRFLRTEHLSDDLAGRSVRGGAVTMANQAAKFSLTLGSMAVLARILTPEDFGLVAMVVSMTMFLMMFRDLGLSMATVQRAEVSHPQVSTLFWVNALVGVVLAVVCAALAPAVVWFYEEPRLLRVTFVLAGAFAFIGLGAQHQAILRRQMKFGALAMIEVLAMLISIAVAIVAAVLGASYWALVLLHVLREVVTTAGLWVACRWRPGRPVRRSGVRSMLAFGGNITGFNVINYFARNLDKVLIGWQAGAGPLGLYSNAYRILLLPTQQINLPLTAVAVPALSRLQNDPPRFRAFFRRGMLLVVAVGMPAVAFLFVAAERAILAILGPQWTDAVLLFRVLAPAAFASTFSVSTGWVFVSLGQANRQLRWGTFASVVTALAFVIGLRWGAVGVAAAASVAFCALRLPATIYCFRETPLRLADLGYALWRPALASITSGAALYAIDRTLLPSLGPITGLIVEFVIYVVLYAAAWVATPGGWRSAGDILRLTRELRPRRPESV